MQTYLQRTASRKEKDKVGHHAPNYKPADKTSQKQAEQLKKS